MSDCDYKADLDDVCNAVDRIDNKLPELRDYFAAKAMSGWIASFDPEMPYLKADGIAALTKQSYAIADAMLTARQGAPQ